MRERGRVIQFLERAVRPDGYSLIETRVFKNGRPRQRFHANLQDLEREVWLGNEHVFENDVYFGVCPRTSKDGSKSGVSKASCLWVDMDGKDFPGGKAEALERLKSYPLPPAFMVDSGNGYHGYWPYDLSVDVRSEGDRIAHEGRLRWLALELGGDSSVAEVARIMRLPVTYNWKNPKKPLPVTFVRFDPSIGYSPSDFPESRKGGSRDSSPITPDKPDWLSESLENFQNGNRNITITRVTGRLHRAGLSPADVLALLWPHAEKADMSRDEFERTINGVCARYPQGEDVTRFQVSSPYIGMKSEIGSYETTSLNNLLQEKDLDMQWLIEGLIPLNSISILSAPAGTGKTWLLMDLAARACARWFVAWSIYAGQM